jgi:hypothetical protein
MGAQQMYYPQHHPVPPIHCAFRQQGWLQRASEIDLLPENAITPFQSQQAWKPTIVAEKILSKKLATVIKQAGATGYTVMAAGGEGSRYIRSTGEPSLSHTLANVKIEVLTGTRELANKIAQQVDHPANQIQALRRLLDHYLHFPGASTSRPIILISEVLGASLSDLNEPPTGQKCTVVGRRC